MLFFGAIDKRRASAGLNIDAARSIIALASALLFFYLLVKGFGGWIFISRLKINWKSPSLRYVCKQPSAQENILLSLFSFRLTNIL